MRKGLFLLFLLIFWGLRLSANEPPALPFAYVTSGDDTFYDLRVMNVETGEEIYFVNTSGFDCPLSISPNSQWLMFSRGSSSPLNRQSYLVDLTTGEEYPFLPDEVEVAWSSDGSRMAYTYDDGLYVLDMETRFLHGLGQYYSIVAYQWLEDDLLFVVDKQNELEVYRWNETEQVLLNILKRPLGDAYVRISPDGAFIQLTIRTENPDDRWLHSVVSIKTNTNILDGLAVTWFGSWLPDSSSFVYVDADTGISFYDVNDNSSQQLVENSSLESDFSYLIWSPSGSYLAYRQYHAMGTYNKRYDLKIVDMETDKIRLIENWVSTYAGQMQWVSPTQLVYTYANSERESPPPREQNNLWLYNVETGEKTQLTDTPDLNEEFICLWG